MNKIVLVDFLDTRYHLFMVLHLQLYFLLLVFLILDRENQSILIT